MSKTIKQSTPDVEVAIIGAGIVGIGIFRHLAMNSCSSVALFDRGNFCEQTSARSSKLLHGGIRYLEKFSFSLIRQALAEKKFWSHALPSFVQERYFYFPLYKGVSPSALKLRAGLCLYDFLSGFKNPPHFYLSSKDINKDGPLSGLKKENLVGIGVYSDAVMDDKLLGISLLQKTQEQCPRNTSSYPHYNLQTSTIRPDGLFSLNFETPEGKKTITARYCVWCLGPFTDTVLSQQNWCHWRSALSPSQGSHLYLSKEDFSVEHTFILRTPPNRVIFVIPQEKSPTVLVGTTEITPTGDLYSPSVSRAERLYLLECLNEYFPKYSLTEKSIVDEFSGIRPLIGADSSDLGGLSREEKIFTLHSRSWAIAGGKYTTFRIMGLPIVQSILRHQGRPFLSHRFNNFA